ncbi:hypothetical protein KXQ82_03230 [Mucilaginibacter sp. HMF5004]|uniref:hypothetical protein n=1 Tax=Mucilaginibacter rivuli TaxID=2857527 RepID=UPI001C5F81DE|nr:hypothetical protein [Mucilaginibacter rivuli]MBW4888706.1 hypothetical protein [Mucilaginibacter rivuli]
MLFLFSITWGSFSVWWALACLLLGAIYAWLLYSKAGNLSNNIRYLLAGLRFLAVTIIAFLLLSPMIKTMSSRQQKPLVLVVQDNSSSINLFKPKGFEPAKLVDDLGTLKKTLGNDYDVREFHFAVDLKDSLSANFNGKQTDLSGVFSGLADRFSNQNIGALVLATDGLYNKGSSPQYVARNLKTNIYTVALGDTIPKRDLLIANINYNKTAFLGNDFEVEVLTEAYQSKGENLHLSISEDGTPVGTQNISIPANEFRKAITVKLHADKKGVHKFSFNLQPAPNEISATNNSETIYVEVLDSKQKILVLYNNIHPDISAIKSSLEGNRNYEVKTSLLNEMTAAKLSGYSAVILYQIPSAGAPVPTALQAALTQSKIPVWYIAGAQSNLQQLNSLQKMVQINSSRLEMQEVFANPKADFAAFTLSDSTRQTLASLPPLSAPFGNYGTANAQTVLLKQKIGSVETSYPLLAFGDDNGRRIAILTAEGLWKWRLAEFRNEGNYSAVDELMSQSVQYLTANNNRQRFRVYPAKNVFDESEDILLNAELYNDALQLINTPDVKIDLKSKAGKTYSFIFTRNGQSYQLNAGALPPDEYTYAAATKLGDKLFNATGQFVIKVLNAETRQSTADHHLLQALAKDNGGQMVSPSQISTLADMIRKNENIKTIVYDDKTYRDLVDVKWVFFLVLALLSAEWFLRKRDGEV